jgi:hypothetical protein
MNSNNTPNRHIPDDLLLEYLDRALPRENFDDIQTHIEKCPTCTQRIAELRALFSRLDNLPDIALEGDLVPAVLGVIKGNLSLPPIWRWSLLIQGILALGMILMAATQLGFPDHSIQAIELFTSHLNASLGEWITFIGATRHQISRLVEFRLPISLNLPLQSVFWLLLSATLTWIIGNLILLRPRMMRAKR